MNRETLLTPNDLAATESVLPWWAVYTRHQHEKTAAKMMATKGLEVFLPMYASVRRWRDRRKLLYLPLFPGYIFVRGALARRLQILTTPGVHMILCRGEEAATIPEDEIEAIRRTLEGNHCVEPHPFLKCGQQVRVTRGSLSGIEGILVRKKSVFRLVLSVQMLAQSVSVEIDASDVEPVSARAAISIPERELSVSRLPGNLTIPFGVPLEPDTACLDITAAVE